MNSPWGTVQIGLESAQLVAIRGATDCAVFFGQGYADARLRLWQLDLSRRVAAGELSEIMGSEALRTDIFQRRLGLRKLAARAQAQDAAAAPNSWQGQQYQHIQAYIAGINYRLNEKKCRPIECLLLRYRPALFTVTDGYLLGQLKYFINSAWQYELFHTRLANRLNMRQHCQLLATISQNGTHFPPLPITEQGDYPEEVSAALKDGLRALQLLGLASPDTGSNVIVVSGKHTESGKPIVAADPHMGHVNPGFNSLHKLESGEGLAVTGSHFPGTPGIIVGRNAQAAWGMVGIMADNQDLFWGKMDKAALCVETLEGWVPLQKREHHITTRKGSTHVLITYDFAHGQLLREKGDYGLFLRWPALDYPSGDITCYQLAKCHDKTSFRAALKHIHNSPMMVGYADIHGDIGLQAMGYIPKRSLEIGSLILRLDHPQHQWQGYIPFEDLPCEYNPPNGYAFYANQYDETLFAEKAPLSNRWHPPSRALRLQALLTANHQHNVTSLQKIQDDQTDVFVHRALTVLLPYLDEPSELANWDGNTQNTQAALLFDYWFMHLTNGVLSKVLKHGSRMLYTDFWPSYRWCLINILQHHLSDWGHHQNDARAIVQTAYRKATASRQNTNLPWVEFRHSIKKPWWLSRLLTGRYPYSGGNRETVHATRQNADFLTQSQAGAAGKHTAKPYTFGPAFKLVCPLDEHGTMHYLINTPAKGTPFFWQLARLLRRWQTGKRERTTLLDLPK